MEVSTGSLNVIYQYLSCLVCLFKETPFNYIVHYYPKENLFGTIIRFLWIRWSRGWFGLVTRRLNSLTLWHIYWKFCSTWFLDMTIVANQSIKLYKYIKVLVYNKRFKRLKGLIKITAAPNILILKSIGTSSVQHHAKWLMLVGRCLTWTLLGFIGIVSGAKHKYDNTNKKFVFQLR